MRLRHYLPFSFSLFLEYIVEFYGGYWKCGGVTFLLANEICACVLLCCKFLSLICHMVNIGRNGPQKDFSLGFSIIFKKVKRF